MRYLLCLLLFVVALPCRAEDAPHKPTYAQCKRLAYSGTPVNERNQLTQLFKTHNLYCAINSSPFNVQNIFNGGQSKAELRLTLQSNGNYAIDGKSVLNVLLPDREHIPPAQLVMLAGQVISIVGELFDSSFDADTLRHASGKAGALAAGLGVNARIGLQQLKALREQVHLKEDDIIASFWLTHLARIEPPAAPQQQNAGQHPMGGPAWMQKLMGAGKHIFSTFQQGGGE